MWWVDDGGYYSSPNATYLEYGPMVPAGTPLTLDEEAGLLKAALRAAYETGRILILPAFGCHNCTVTGVGGTVLGCAGAWPLSFVLTGPTHEHLSHTPHGVGWGLGPVVLCIAWGRGVGSAVAGPPGGDDSCSMVAHFRVSALDKELQGVYREHMFRYAHGVPPTFRLNPAQGMLPATRAGAARAATSSDCGPGCVVVPAGSLATLGSVVAAVRGAGPHPVVRLEGLTLAAARDPLSTLGESPTRAAFEDRLGRALVRATPRQYV
jgi:hypothetical protein